MNTNPTATHKPATATTTAALLIDEIDTPLGPFTVIADGAGRLHASGWDDDQTDGRMDRCVRTYGASTEIKLVRARDPGGISNALRAYFAGELAAIDQIPIADVAGTPFQRAVWRALRTIPCGQTTSYGAIARQIGRPAAVRAVGMTNGANPIGLVVPCHRVIGADGKLVGYGGGIERKRWLLAHERARQPGTTLELPLAHRAG